jgi:flotillin
LIGKGVLVLPGCQTARGIRSTPARRTPKRSSAEKWPEIGEAGARAFSNIDPMVVLNGADGMSDMFAKALSLGGTGLGLARQLMDATGTKSSGAGELAGQNGDLTTRD